MTSSSREPPSGPALLTAPSPAFSALPAITPWAPHWDGHQEKTSWWFSYVWGENRLIVETVWPVRCCRMSLVISEWATRFQPAALSGWDPLTLAHGLQSWPGPVEQTRLLGRAPQLVAHFTGEAQEALGLKLLSKPRPMGWGTRITAKSRVISCRPQNTWQ